MSHALHSQAQRGAGFISLFGLASFAIIESFLQWTLPLAVLLAQISWHFH
jgi:hypothetical protein